MIVTVAAAASTSGAALTVTGRKVKGLALADLKWNGLTGSAIDVYRNSAKFETTSNDGVETDSINKKGSFTYTYKVCVAGTNTCSNQASVTF